MWMLPYEGRHVPHVVVEVNQRCNITCAACYKDRFGLQKPLDEVRADIDLACSLRDLSALTLAGGEPTLHPDLPEIVRYVASKGIAPHILTNGHALDPALLGRLREAGLSELFVHVDGMQTRPDLPKEATEAERNAFRARIAKLVTDHGIRCSMIITLYKRHLGNLPEIVEFILRDPNVCRLLVTCYNDFHAIASGFSSTEVLGRTYERPPVERTVWMNAAEKLTGEAVTLGEVRSALADRFGMEPFGAVGSSLDPEAVRWIVYYAFSIHGSRERTLALSPAFARIASRVYARARRKGKPYSFGGVPSGLRAVLACVAYAVATLSVREAWRVAGFLMNLLRPGTTIRHKGFTFQEGPRLTADGRIDYCRDCPDATIREGGLVPVCLSDILAPLPKGAPRTELTPVP